MRDRVGADPNGGSQDVGKFAACQDFQSSIMNGDGRGLSSKASMRLGAFAEKTDVRAIKPQDFSVLSHVYILISLLMRPMYVQLAIMTGESQSVTGVAGGRHKS